MKICCAPILQYSPWEASFVLDSSFPSSPKSESVWRHDGISLPDIYNQVSSLTIPATTSPSLYSDLPACLSSRLPCQCLAQPSNGHLLCLAPRLVEDFCLKLGSEDYPENTKPPYHPIFGREVWYVEDST